MILYPAIDLMGGEVVRLEQGRADRKKVYSPDPVGMANQWAATGAAWLHVVDLDGAFSGELKNLPVVAAMAETLSIPLQLGGGLRTIDSVRRALDAGVARVILGSRACEDPSFVEEAVKEFGGDKIAVGIDAKNGLVATRGWTETSGRNALELAREVEYFGIGALIYTDIATDGMLLGPNFAAMEAMVQTLQTPVIASGGVSSVEDIKKLSEISGLYGAIIGKALYEGRVTLEECLSITR